MSLEDFKQIKNDEMSIFQQCEPSEEPIMDGEDLLRVDGVIQMKPIDKVKLLNVSPYNMFCELDGQLAMLPYLQRRLRSTVGGRFGTYLKNASERLVAVVTGW